MGKKSKLKPLDQCKIPEKTKKDREYRQRQEEKARILQEKRDKRKLSGWNIEKDDPQCHCSRQMFKIKRSDAWRKAHGCIQDIGYTNVLFMETWSDKAKAHGFKDEFDQMIKNPIYKARVAPHHLSAQLDEARMAYVFDEPSDAIGHPMKIWDVL
jgi:hypothetical protein